MKSIFANSLAIAEIQKKIDWMLFLAKAIDDGNNYYAEELAVLEEEKKEVMKKVIEEEVAKKYADLEIAHAVKRDAQRRKIERREKREKMKSDEFRKEGSLRIRAGRKIIIKKAGELILTVHEEIERWESEIFADDSKIDVPFRKRGPVVNATNISKKIRLQ